MNSQNRSVRRQPASNASNPKGELSDHDDQWQSSPDTDDPPELRTDVKTTVQSTMDLLDRYSQLLDELNIEHAETTQAHTDLESDIMAREIICGRLMRQHLEIGEQIRLQKESILAQKNVLKSVQMKREKSASQKEAVVKKIAALASSFTK